MSQDLYYKKPAALWQEGNSIDLATSTVIEASAGTGKTYTLEHLFVALLLDAEATVDQILVVTYTRRAANEMKARIRRLLAFMLRGRGESFTAQVPPGEQARYWPLDVENKRRLRDALHGFDQAQVFTIHSFCQQWLTRHAFETANLFDGVLVSESDVFDPCFFDVLRRAYAHQPQLKRWLHLWLAQHLEVGALSGALKDLHGKDVALLPEYTPQDRLEILAEAEGVDRRKQTPDDTLKQKIKTAVLHEFRPLIEEEVRRRKLTDGLYTYQDMLEMVGRTIAQGDASNTLLEAMCRSYRFGLIDEFQDTDPIQWDIFRRVFVDSPSSNVLYLIGDPKQSIYGFRGADVDTYREACKYLKQEPVHLNKNYRSTAAMIEAYNLVFEGFFTGNNSYPQPVVCGNTRRWVKRQDTGETPAAISIFRYPTSEPIDGARAAIREAFADEIESLLRDKPVLVYDSDAPGEERRLGAGDIFILTRRKDAGRNIAAALRKRGIPYAFYRQEGLFQTDEAHHIHDLLAAVATPGDRGARRKALLTPFFNVALEDVGAVDSADHLDSSPRTTLEKWHRLAAQRRYNKLFDSMLHHSGLIRREIFLETSERSLTNFEHIFEILRDEASRRQCEVSELSAWFKSRVDGSETDDGTDSDLQRLETDRQTVQIMTIHKSKGLQAQVVFLYDELYAAPGKPELRLDDGRKAKYLGNGLFQDKHKERCQKYVAEEIERVYYVAMTRAISQLYLPYIKGLKGKRDYLKVQKHLTPLLPRIERGELGNLFSIREVPDVEFTVYRDTSDAIACLSRWQPPAMDQLLAPPIPSSTFGNLRDQDLAMVSYSKLKQMNLGGASKPGEKPRTADAWEHVKTSDLPGGTQAGLLLHEILEFLDYSTILEAPDFDTWRGRADVDELVAAMMQKFRFDEERYGHSARRIIYDTLTTEVDDGYSSPIRPLAGLDPRRMQREVRFTFAIPEASWPPPNERRGPVDVTRGYAEGVVDLLFERNGRVYFADWKSDTLERGDYTQPKLLERIAERYPSQATLYTMAVVRMLNINDRESFDARFGGFYYFFLRGMGQGEGVYYERPTWDDVMEQEARLKAADTKQGWQTILASGANS